MNQTYHHSHRVIPLFYGKTGGLQKHNRNPLRTFVGVFCSCCFSFWTYLWDDLFLNSKLSIIPCWLWRCLAFWCHDPSTGSASSGLGRMCDPLIVAAENHHFDVVRCLLDAGFDEKVWWCVKRSVVGLLVHGNLRVIPVIPFYPFMPPPPQEIG